MFLFLFALFALSNAANVVDPDACTSFPCLIFEDEMDFIDYNYWEHEITLGGGGNWEFQAYVNNRSITYTRDSVLYIKPGLTSDWAGSEDFLTSGTFDVWGSQGRNDVCTGNHFYGCQRVGSATNIVNPIRSGRLRTANRWSVRYGRVEINAKIPRGDWIWPAIWMMPDMHKYGTWPSSGEIDIMEARGNEPRDATDTLGNNYVGCTLHWGPYFELNQYPRTTVQYTDGTSLADAFHTFAVEWNDQTITYFFDNTQIYQIDPGTSFWDYGEFDIGREIFNPWSDGGKMTPFDQDFYLILNVAVGGTGGYFPDGVWPNKPWSDSSTQAALDFYNAKDQWYPTWTNGGLLTDETAAMQIDWIRVYKMVNSEM